MILFLETGSVAKLVVIKSEFQTLTTLSERVFLIELSTTVTVRHKEFM